MDWTAAARHLAGESPPAERAQFEAWLDEKPERRETYAALAPLMRARSPQPQVDVDAAWARVAQTMDEERLVVLPNRTSTRRDSQPRVLWAVAAAAALLVAVFAPRWLPGGGDRMEASATSAAEWRTVVLADGSRALLGPATEIRSTLSTDGPRVIELTGEALFTVSDDPRRAFIVRAKGAEIEDLGTAFAVRARPEDPTVRVTVTQGSVALRADAADPRQLVLRAGETGEVTGTMARMVPDQPDQALAWTRRELAFDATPLAAVAAELERWYGVSIAVSPAVAQRTLSARFAGEPLSAVLNVVARTVGVTVEYTGDAVLIRER